MEYIEIKNGTVIGHYDSEKIPEGIQYKSVRNFNGWVGMNAGMLNENGQIRPEAQLIAEGFIKDNRGDYWDKKSKQKHTITELGQEPLKEWTDKKPSGLVYEVWDGNAWVIDPTVKKEYDLAKTRFTRNSEFNIFDKYQLPLLWASLSAVQQKEFKVWREAWLNAPKTDIEPARPSWFKE